MCSILQPSKKCLLTANLGRFSMKITVSSVQVLDLFVFICLPTDDCLLVLSNLSNLKSAIPIMFAVALLVEEADKANEGLL